MKPIKSISIIGNGKLARQLGLGLKAAGISIEFVVGRDSDNVRLLANDLQAQSRELEDGLILFSDMVLLAVSDDAIAQVSEQIGAIPGILAHCSGSLAPQILDEKHPNRACFYPLQSFTEGDTIAWREVPVFIQSDDIAVESALSNLGNILVDQVLVISNEQKEVLHLAAVFANNFSNAMYTEASDILSQVELDFDLLRPLIRKTADKLDLLNPEQAQTGPARRGDSATIQKHLDLMEDDELQELYKTLSDRISKRYR